MVFFTTSLLGALYIFVFGKFYAHLRAFKNLEVKKTTKNQFSIIIPFRNEAANLAAIFKDLTNLNYPRNKFEVLFTDDHSEDDSQKIITDLIQKSSCENISLVEAIGYGKKSALNQAINISKNDWVITTDADCRIPKNWLMAYDTYLNKTQKTYLTGPVKLTEKRGFLYNFQQLNFLSLQATTVASFAANKPFMSNGANSCFRKESFLSLKGFQGNQKIASGDDVFLLEKFIKKNSDSVGFLNSTEALVVTESQASWKALLNQKKRWAAKASNYNNKHATTMALLVATINILLIFLTIYYPTYFAILFGIKLSIDFLLLKKTSHLYDSKFNIIYFLLSSIIYPFFIGIVLISSKVSKFEWKGRSLKK